MKTDALGGALVVFLGGAAGGLLRHFLVKEFVSCHVLGDYVATFFINMIACLSIGMASQLIKNTTVKLMVQTGFLGGFSTVAAIMLFATNAVTSREIILNLIYVVITYILGICLASLGTQVIKR